MNTSKDIIRKSYLALRNGQKEIELAEKSRGISNKVFGLKEIEAVNRVGTYFPFYKEVDTIYLIEECIKGKFEVFLPKNLGHRDNYKFCAYEGKNRLVEGKYGIMEPEGKKAIIIDELDAVFVPGVAFDINGVRIGYGKGIYDRLLKNYNGLKVGLAFEFQIAEKLPREKWDVLMDLVVTEERIIKVKS